MYEDLYLQIDIGDQEKILKLTGCLKPCKYKRYNLVRQVEVGSTDPDPEVSTFILWAVTNSTLVEKEQLVYPLSTLVAEFGGTLGLFVGFSFLTAWEEILKGAVFIKSLMMKKI